jgi:3-keto-disaccharide hydrolase
MRSLRAFLVIAAAILLSAAGSPDSDWKQLFNGKDLTGWKHVGPGEMTVTDGMIETHIRIPLEPREPWMPVHYGYEVQIDNHPETSGEDDFHITGTLYSLTKPLAKPAKPGPEWNTMIITIDGPHTIVEINSVKVTDYREGDPVPPRKFDFEPQIGPRPNEGWFGLQNHSKEDTVFFKEISIQPLP